MPDLLSDILFLFQRLTWVSLLDLILVAMVFYTILMLVRDTQAVVLLRGVFLLIILLSLLTAWLSCQLSPGWSATRCPRFSSRFQ